MRGTKIRVADFAPSLTAFAGPPAALGLARSHGEVR